MRRSPSDIVSILSRSLPPEAILTDPVVRAALATDESKLPGDCAAVVRPVTEEQDFPAIRAPEEADFSIVPRGAGTAAAGAATSAAGQEVLDLSGMNRILGIDWRDLVAVVEPGVLIGA